MTDWQTRTDELIVLKALSDALGEEYDAKRAAFFRDAVDAYEEDPTRDRFNSEFGRVSIAFSKEVRPKEVRQFTLTDPSAVGDPFAGNDEFREFVHAEVMKDVSRWAEAYFKDGGEILDGFDVVTVQEVGKPRRPSYITVRKDKDKIREHARELFGEGVAGLLEG